MDKTRNAEIRVGIVSIIGLIVLLGGIYLGKGIAITPAAKKIEIRLPSSGGLEDGSPVVINGVKRGAVTDVHNNDGSVLVKVGIDDYSDLREDASAVVTILEITGGKKVEILPGSSEKPFNPEKEMRGRVAADISGLITQVGDVSGDLVMLLRRLDTISASITQLLADGSLSANLKSMTADGAVLVRDARDWMQTNRQDLTASVRDIRVTIADLKDAVKNNEPKLSSVLDKLDRSLSDLEGTISKADRAIINTDSLVSNINNIVTEIRTNGGLIHAVVYDTAFKRRFDSLVYNLRVFVNETRKNGVNVNVSVGHK
ncbi:MAG: MCE family protein [Ignavibacteria bacterium]|nr:MCE family protein [Ignavibacteria bacterium]